MLSTWITHAKGVSNVRVRVSHQGNFLNQEGVPHEFYSQPPSAEPVTCIQSGCTNHSIEATPPLSCPGSTCSRLRELWANDRLSPHSGLTTAPSLRQTQNKPSTWQTKGKRLLWGKQPVPLPQHTEQQTILLACRPLTGRASGRRSKETPTNPRGIPYAPFVDRVEDYVTSRAETEPTLRKFQEMIA